MKRLILGVVVGVPTRYALIVPVGLLLGVEEYTLVMDSIPILLACLLAGYVARKHGAICGGIIEVLDVLFALTLLWLIGLANIPGYPLTQFLREFGLHDWLRVLRVGIVTVSIGVVGGYAGQITARAVAKHRRSRPRETRATPEKRA